MRKLVYGLVLVHFLLISFSVFHIMDKLLQNEIVADVLSMINTINYSVWRYGFFAPDVGQSIEVEFLVYEDSNSVTRFSTLEGFDFFLNTADSYNRFYGFKHHTANDTLLLDLSARSACTRMFNLYPEALQVDFSLRNIRYPTMEGYRSGDSIQVIEQYYTAFRPY